MDMDIDVLTNILTGMCTDMHMDGCMDMSLGTCMQRHGDLDFEE